MSEKSRKILGKYEIIKPQSGERLGENEFLARTGSEFNIKEFRIKRVAKSGEAANSLCLKALLTRSSQLNIEHKNLKCVSVDEDDDYYYAITPRLEGEEFEPLNRERFCDDDGVDYERLVQCYLQVFDAIKFIHAQGLHHGNIATQNVLVDKNDSVFLLDFGKSYYYELFGEGDRHFGAPEQLGLVSADTDTRADIFSFGLVMLDLLLAGFDDFDFSEYKSPEDLENIFEKIAEYELDDVENDLFLLIKKMTKFEPQERIELAELGKDLEKIYHEVYPCKVYKVKCHETTVARYCYKNKLIADYENFMEHIEKRTEGHKAYIRQIYNAKQGENQLEIAINDVICVCSTQENNDKFLFCKQIWENQLTWLEKIHNEGVEFRDIFSFTTWNYYNPNSKASNIAILKKEFAKKFKEAIDKAKRLEIDKKAVATEDELLAAEKRTIEQKKRTKAWAQLKEIKKGADSVVFTLLDDKKDDKFEFDDDDKNLKGSENGVNLKQKGANSQADFDAIDDENFAALLNEFDSPKSPAKAQNSQENSQNSRPKNKESKWRGFKDNDSVIIEDEDGEFKGVFSAGEVATINAEKNEITIKFAKYSLVKLDETELKKAKWLISYDYQIEEILWSKKDRALQALGAANVQIQDLLRKINEPSFLAPVQPCEVSEFFDKNLDENQQKAVIKALSLESGSELLLIQGPPGTGKTTAITELIRQLLRRHKNNKDYRILLASQSNQAVDNVLEKVCEREEKLLRIGNDESKMSQIAQKFMQQRVLNKIINENLERIKQKPICDENEQIQAKLRGLQEGFAKALNNITETATPKEKQGKAGKSEKPTTKDEALGALFLKNIRLFFGTLLGISSWGDFRKMAFDIAIVDEAGRATLSELLVPCVKARKIVLVGDHKQLAPVIDDEIAQNLNTQNATKSEVGVSFFERFWDRLETSENGLNGEKPQPHLVNFKHRLTYNYRAENRICQLYGEAFYDGELVTAEAIKNDRAHGLEKWFKSSVVWLDTSKRSDRLDKQAGTGKINICNKNLIKFALEKLLFEQIKAQNLALSIGIITPYRAQTDLLKNELRGLQSKFKELYKDKTGDKDLKSGFDIGTVDSFQGSDRDIIIYDCVRSGVSGGKNGKNRGKIDFIADEKRLNVSLSRAKKLLIIVGDMDFLYGAIVSGGNNPFHEIIGFMRAKENKADYQIIDTATKGQKNG